MRKSAIIVGIGAFCLALALLLRFFAYDRLAVVPVDQNTQQTLSDPNAKYFDADKVAPGQGNVATTVTVVGDKKASEEASDKTGKNVMVFNKWQSTDNNDVKPPMDAVVQRIAIDRHTGEAIDCCSTTQNGKPTKYSGQIIKWPFQTEKKSYPYYDGTIGKPMTMKFAGEDEIEGLKVYKFTGSVPMTKFREQEVPQKLFGLPDKAVTADRLYSNNRTMWVEPETGVIIKGQEQQHQILKIDAKGAKPATAIQTTQTFSDATVKKNVDEYSSKATSLKIVRVWAPIVLGLLGLVLLLAGVAMSLRARPSGASDDTQDELVSWDEMNQNPPTDRTDRF
ncbi:DUF3068 domain-containing protein [Demetria terragena]|uniref:DUF3068 domain-containing protein n=1 Tax=Demetria terragena TaxID=63959 RepID=UPI00037D4C6F|nr:DUF3068 domain-containing protein [Demetria terragena]